MALLACWYDRDTLAAVRDRVHTISTSQGLPAEDGYRLVLAVHEAAANAVRHGGGHGQLLLWRRDGRLWCEISDHGPGINATTERRDHDTNNGWPARHGLWLIQRLCTSLDITTDTTGTRLLLSYRLDRRAAA